MVIHHLRALVSQDFEAVNTFILDSTQSSISLIDDLLHHLIKSGGKRLRPLLVLLSCRACQYEGTDHIQLATMIEFFHTVTLLHDDVVDESTLRRGRQSANMIWGNRASILAGDYLFSRYVQLMLQINDLGIMKILTDMTCEMSYGELTQLFSRRNLALTEADYLSIIRAKTSLLFAASCQASARLAKTPFAIEHALETFGLHFGNAYQLMDDALDYCSNKETLGKNIGDDLTDGKLTMPLLFVLQHGTPLQQEKIKTALMKASLDDLPDVLSILDETKAIEHTQKAARSEMERAVAALHILPHSIYKNALIDLAEYAVSRDH